MLLKVTIFLFCFAFSLFLCIFHSCVANALSLAWTFHKILGGFILQIGVLFCLCISQICFLVLSFAWSHSFPRLRSFFVCFSIEFPHNTYLVLKLFNLSNCIIDTPPKALSQICTRSTSAFSLFLSCSFLFLSVM